MAKKKMVGKSNKVNLSRTFGSQKSIKVALAVVLAVVAVSLLYVSLRSGRDVAGQAYTPVPATCTDGDFYISDNDNDGFFDEVERCLSNTLGTCTGTQCTTQKTIEVKTNGGPVTVGTAMVTTTQSFPKTVGEQLTLIVTTPQAIAGSNGNSQLTFTGWSDMTGANQPATRTLTVKTDVTGASAIEARWVRQHKLTLKVQDSGVSPAVEHGVATANPVGTIEARAGNDASAVFGAAQEFYNENEQLVLRAVPTAGSGYFFVGWIVEFEQSGFPIRSELSLADLTFDSTRPFNKPFTITAKFIKLPAPVLHLSFDSEAEPFRDDSGHNAQVFGTGTLTPGKVGNAMKLDGVKDRVRVANIAALQGAVGPTRHSIEFWVKVGATPAAAAAGAPANRAWIARLGRLGDRSPALLLNSDSTTRFGPFGTNVPATEVSNPSLSTTDFKHVVMTYDGGSLKTYVDGAITQTVLTSFNFQAIPLIESGMMPLVLGKPLLNYADELSSERYFNGVVDEVKVYNRDLTAGEVKKTYDIALTTTRTAVTADTFVWKDEMSLVGTADPIVRQWANGPHHHKTRFPLEGAGGWEGVEGYLLQQQLPGTVPVKRLADFKTVDVEGASEGTYQRYVLKEADVTAQLAKWAHWSDKGPVGFMAPPLITEAEASDVFGGRKVVPMFEGLASDGHTVYTDSRREMTEGFGTDINWRHQDTVRSGWSSERVLRQLVGWSPQMAPLGKIFPRKNYPDASNLPLRFERPGITIPGVVQAEDFNLGGEGVAYHDTSHGAGSSYRWQECDGYCGGFNDQSVDPTDPTNPNRQRGVDVYPIAGRYGYKVGAVRGGEYLVYTVNIEQEGDYDIKAYIARPHSVPEANLQDFLQMDITKNVYPYGWMPIAKFDAPFTGSYELFTGNLQKAISSTGSVANPGVVPVQLKKGQYLIRVKVAYAQDSRGDLDNNLDRFEFILKGATPKPKVVLFDECGFKGASYEVDESGLIPNLHKAGVHQANAVSSVKVFGGASVQLYENPLIKDNMWSGDSGRSVMVTADLDCGTDGVETKAGAVSSANFIMSGTGAAAPVGGTS